jgi:hypothetical protein
MPYRGDWIGRRRQPPGRHLQFYDPVYVLFDDRSLAGVDEIDFPRFRIDTDDFMAFLGQATRRNGPDVSKTPDA